MAGRLHFIFLYLVTNFYTSYGFVMGKSSLTFVIDDTGSMWDDIDQDKQEANEIFETVLKSNASQIEYFILVTFNDPDIRLRVVTNDKNAFKRALEDISVHGGGDCPEYAMTEVEEALANYLPLSYLLTDASAKDHHEFEKIKSIWQKKQSQVSFVLTGICGTRRDADYIINHKIANAINGQVFHTDKHEVKDVLAYVKEVIKSRGTVVGSKHFPPGYNNTMEYNVDGDTGDVLIVVTGDKPKIGTVTGPEGSKPTIETIMDNDQTTIVKATGSKAGMYSVKLGSKSQTHAVITAKTSINFQLGFSVLKPTSISDTVSTPPPDGKAFLSIKLLGEQAVLNTAKILDMSYNVIAELPLELIDTKEKLYLTAFFNPPYTMFRISVSGYDEKSKSLITRTSPTTIKRQHIKTETTTNVSPRVTIEGTPTITTQFGKPVEISCKVHAYPKPDIIWEVKDTGISLPAPVSLLDEPYDYISILRIEKAENKTYQCKGSNSLGLKSDFIEVKTERTAYIEAPKPEKTTNVSPRVTIEGTPTITTQFGKPVEISCKVHAYPKPDIIWEVKDTGISLPAPVSLLDEPYDYISILRIEKAENKTYQCKGSNSLGLKSDFIEVKTERTAYIEAPKPEKTTNVSPRVTIEGTPTITTQFGKPVEISCKVHAYPKPDIIWEEKDTGISLPAPVSLLDEPYDYISILRIEKAENKTYQCKGSNSLGLKSDFIEVKTERTAYIEAPKPEKTTNVSPRVTIEGTPTITTQFGKPVEISCKVHAYPKPDIIWEEKDTGISLPAPVSLLDEPYDYISILRIEKAENKTYQCKGSNSLGLKSDFIEVKTERTAYIEAPKPEKTTNVSPRVTIEGTPTITTQYGKPVEISCKVHAYPKPDIIWEEKDTGISLPATVSLLDEPYDYISILRIEKAENKTYQCKGSNSLGLKSDFIEVKTERTAYIEAPKPEKTTNVSPRVTIEGTPTITTQFGKPVEISCKVHAYPKPDIIWEEKDTGISLPATVSLLEEPYDYISILRIEKAENKTYQCKGRNSFGLNSDFIEVKTERTAYIEAPKPEKTTNVSPRVTIEGTPTITTQFGKPVEISCKVHAYPKPDIIWEEKDTGISLPAPVSLLEEPYDYISILRIEKAENKTYQCKGRNSFGLNSDFIEVKTERTAYIEAPKPEKTTNVSPRVTIEGTPTITTQFGKPVEISCKVHAYPKPDIIWEEKDTGISLPAPVSLLDEPYDYISILRIEKAENKTYQCKGSNSLGLKSDFIEVKTERTAYIEAPKPEKTTNVSPRVTIEGTPTITTQFGKPVEISCKVHAYPKPDIIWEEKDTGISLPAPVSLLEEPYDYISILRIEKAENKTYQCKGSNSFGLNSDFIEVKTERTAYFSIIEAPKPDINVTYNEEGSIVCKVDAYPPATITWFKDKNVITPDENIAMSSDNSTLTIKHMQPDTAGTFVCEARNSKNKEVFISNVNVSGLEKPMLDEDYEGLIEVNEGDNVQLLCKVIGGKPKPTIRWLFASDYVGDYEFSYIHVSSEEIHFKNISKKQGGYYDCVATNVAGSARRKTYIMVLFPPIINDNVKAIRALDGDEIIIPCDADGTPKPEVTWYRNGVQFMSKRDPASTYGLRFRATLSDSGYYTCKANSKLGTANKTVSVIILAPVTIDVPKVSKIETMVGKNVTLPCRADGFPRPRITWDFYRSGIKIPPKNVTPVDESRSDLQLRSIQLYQQGIYICVASNNVGEPASIFYEVIVKAPPIIENVYIDKIFEVVEGDLVLRIQCNATGSPKPTIIWKKNGLNIAFGPESFRYDMEEDGTLIIKNIDDKSRGSYECLAQNTLGKDTEMFEVVVDKNPKLKYPMSISTISLNVGESTDLYCNIPHTKTDLLRWYKDGVLKASGELRLENAKLGDDGLYTCRVSDFLRSRSVHTKVQIGEKPTFISTEKEEIEFSEGSYVLLICEATGHPTPKVSWKHNGKNLNKSQMVYAMNMTIADRGIFECEVSNDFGTINRSFRIQSKDCILDIKKDFTGNHPMMLSQLLKQTPFEIVNGYMKIPKNQYFILYCPSKFANFASKSIATAFCEGESKVKINGKTYTFRDIQCREEVKPEELRTGTACLPGYTENVKIGFILSGYFYEVYQVCLDKVKNVPVFTKQMLRSDLADSSQETKWLNSDLLPLDFDRMYDCRHQTFDFCSTFGRDVTSHSSCCYSKRQLVNSHDLPPGVPVTAAFSYLNVIPQWSTCNSRNWDDVEHRVRKLAKSAGRDLLVWTGTAKPFGKPRSTLPNVTLDDGRGGKQPVAEYLWKIVQDPHFSTSLAIIQLNIPGLSRNEASRYALCQDICYLTKWMQNENWSNVDDGFTFCCTISTFEKAFGFHGMFSPAVSVPLQGNDPDPDNRQESLPSSLLPTLPV